LSTFDQLPASYCRMHQTVTERVDEQGIYCSDRWVGPWESRADFLRIAMGQEETIEYPGSYSVTRIIPLKYPGADPMFDNVYAYDVQMEGIGRSSSSTSEGITFAKAIVTVQYRSWPFYFPGGGDYPLMTVTANASADVVTVPGTAYEFPSDSLRLDRNAGVLVPKVDFALTFHFLPSLNLSLYTSLCGFVNSTTFYGFSSGFVQYVGPASSSTLRVGGQYTHTVSHQFQYRRIKHNEIMRPDGTGFEAPERVGSSDNLLPTADLNALFGN
jgi:hypothetical protein